MLLILSCDILSSYFLFFLYLQNIWILFYLKISNKIIFIKIFNNKKIFFSFTSFHLLTVFNPYTLLLIIFINRKADLFSIYKLLKSVLLWYFENFIPVLLKLVVIFSLKYCPGPTFNLFKIGLCLADWANLGAKMLYLNNLSSGLYFPGPGFYLVFKTKCYFLLEVPIEKELELFLMLLIFGS